MSRIAEKQDYGTSPQGSGYEYVHRSVCRPAEEPARKGGTDSRRSGGTYRSYSNGDLSLGIRSNDSIFGEIPENFRSLWYQNSDNSTRKIIFTNRQPSKNVLSSSPALTPIFQESKKFSSVYIPTFLEWRDFARFYIPKFSERNVNLKRIFSIFNKYYKIPVDGFVEFIKITTVKTIVGIPTAYSAPVRLARPDSIDI